MRKKKGDKSTTGIEISVLVLLIGFFIIIYVILLPPEAREELLNETAEVPPEDEFVGVGGKVLLSESPGEVFSYTTNIHTINIEPMHIFSREESEVFSLIKAMTVSRNLLKDNFKTVYFDLDDLTDLKKVQLFFVISESEGPMQIYLNEKLLFDGQLSSSQLPLELPLSNLQEKNKLEFYAASPGYKLFSSNHYIIQDVQLLKTFKVEKTKSTRTFYVSEEVGQRINRASLNYFVTCNKVDQRPTLTISLNSRKVFRDTVFCEYLEERTLPLSKSVLNAYGRNTLEMEIDKGDINVDDVKLKTELSKSIFPTYTFDVSSELWSRVQEGEADVVLKMTMESGRKKARIFVQGEQFNMDTSSLSYEKDITDMVDNGANVLKIEPLNNFEIVNLKVVEE